IEIEIQEKIDLNQIAQKYRDIEYNPKKFPSLIIRIEDSSVIILIFSNGIIKITGLMKDTNVEQLIDRLIKSLSKIGIKLDKKRNDQKYEIDYTDSVILNILQSGQGFKPISTYDISKIFKEQMKMDISQSTIHNRIKNLEQKGIILNYTVNFNPKKIGYEGKYLLRMKPRDPSKYDNLALKLEKNKHITDLFRIGEQYGLFAIIRVKRVEDYAKLIRELYETEDIEDTFTNFVLDELIPYTNFVFY
ncbi:MAG: Lrp/AsnC ligand binding domain-containing protein, partial [Candidatus Heimdallarchaeota archaeon]